ncbi:MAG: hypothetical protein WD768_01320 [Phycisphaeraceae bacterium]
MRLNFTAIAALTLVITANASAVTFYTISGVTSATSGTDFFAAANLIQGVGVGFSASAPHDRTSSLTWVTAGNGADYFAALPNPRPRLVFDLGADTELNEISLWGYANTNANGVRTFDLRFATAADGPAGLGTSILYNPSFTLASQSETLRQSFEFNKLIARYVEILPTDNFRGFGFLTPGGDRVGLGEVAFAVPVPEPTTAMCGLVALSGLALRRHRAAA